MIAAVSGELDSEAVAFVRAQLGEDAQVDEVAGDASTRRFFRVSTEEATAILMVHGEPLAPNAPLFSNHRILSEIGAPVPDMLAREEGLGLVLVEDFGDWTLQRHLLATEGDPEIWIEKALPLYRAAGDIIVLMQERGAGALRPDDFAATNALDRERFLFELDHFDRHFIRGLRGGTPTPSEERLLRAFYEDLAEACDRLPRVYCHRDFQSRNLMVLPKRRLGLVDFQDARMGPYTYDAASLLRDSSLDLPSDFVDRMLERLAGPLGRPLAIGPEELRRDFDLMALQRNIKDLGTFGYMATVRGRRDYLDYVPRTQASIRATMVANPRWHDPFAAMNRLALT